jgi:hypothetical protein
MPLESQAIAAARDLAHVADGATADHIGQLEDLGNGQDRPFGRCLTSSSPDTARIVRKNLVFDSRHEDCAHEPVRFGRHGG